METTEGVIHKLFYRMKEMYGGAWVSTLHGEDVATVKGKWLKSLSVFSAEDIGKALSCIKQQYRKVPPTLLEFRNFVKKLKHQKSGHLSDVVWSTPDWGLRASEEAKSSYLDKCKEFCK